MKLRTNLAAVGIALTVGLAAQAAEARNVQCPGGGEGGGGEQQVELGQDGGSCDPQASYTPLSVTAHDANGAAYTVETMVEDGDELLELGEVVEVEIDLDDFMASLKANEQDAVALAAAFGFRPAGSKAGVADAGHAVGKLSEAEFESVAKHVYVSLQSGRATGRSDPAGPSTSRWIGLQQAFSRAVTAMGAALSQTRIGPMYVRTYHSSGVQKTERTATVEVTPAD